MDEKDFNERTDREEIFSKSVRAGKRTYFFDVKATKTDELYLTITESKRRFNNETGKFFYEKHKLFLYSEDFDKFISGLYDTIKFIKTGELPPPDVEDEYTETETEPNSEAIPAVKNEFTDVDFDDLTASDPKE
jgi:hypothetical protein